jgi:hypothetical protein
MGPKEWSRFGDDVWKYAQKLKTGEIPSKIHDTRTLLLICGYPGSGRAEFVEKLKTADRKWIFVNHTGDEGKKVLSSNFTKNVDICVDTSNVTLTQRKFWYKS